MRLRTATAEDADAVLQLWVESGAPGRAIADTADSVARLLSWDPEALLLAIDDDDTIIGTVIAGWDGWRASIYRLAVADRARRRGVARQLVAAAEARFRSVGAVRSDAMVTDANQLGVAFWAAAGYEADLVDHRWFRFLDSCD